MTRRISIALVVALFNLLSVVAQDDAKMNKYMLHIEEYFSFYNQNQMDSAEMALRKAIELIPDAEGNFMLQGNLAELVAARKDTLQAISLLSSALGAQPDADTLRERRAELLAATGRRNEALSDLDYIVKRLPNQEVPRYRRALLLMDMDLWDGAKSDLEHIIKNNDNAYLPRVTLAKVELEREDERTAERILSFLIEKYPDIPVAYRARARLFISQNRKAEALKDIRTVIQKGKDITAEDYEIRGDIWKMYGETTQAQKDYEQAKSLRDIKKN